MTDGFADKVVPSKFIHETVGRAGHVMDNPSVTDIGSHGRSCSLCKGLKYAMINLDPIMHKLRFFDNIAATIQGAIY